METDYRLLDLPDIYVAVAKSTVIVNTAPTDNDRTSLYLNNSMVLPLEFGSGVNPNIRWIAGHTPFETGELPERAFTVLKHKINISQELLVIEVRDVS